MFNAELLAEAEKELANAYDWYEEQLTSLGNRFYKEVKYYLTLIENNPYLFQVKVFSRIACCVIKQISFSYHLLD